MYKQKASENEIESYLIKQANLHGYLCYKFKSPGTNGVPDRILIGHDKIIFVETKAPGKKPRPLQQAIHEEMREHGATIYVTDSKSKIDNLFTILSQNTGGTLYEKHTDKKADENSQDTNKRIIRSCRIRSLH